MRRPTRPDDQATPEEARAILAELARVCDEQPTFDLPNPLDRMLWERELARAGKLQRPLFGPSFRV